MKIYLSEILPLLKKFSKTLDQTSILVDKPWVVKSRNNEYQKLIFKRDGKLLLSKNGNLTEGSWEYIAGANSLIIDYGTFKILYRHSYVDEAVMALKKDGDFSDSDSEVFLLANENLIPNVDATGYLKSKYYEQEGLVTLPLDNGEIILANHSKRFDYGLGYQLSELNSNIKSGIYKSKSHDIRYLVENDGTIRVHRKLAISQEAYIWASNGLIPVVGDEAVGFTYGEFKVKIDDYDKYKIKVCNGVVEYVKYMFFSI